MNKIITILSLILVMPLCAHSSNLNRYNKVSEYFNLSPKSSTRINISKDFFEAEFILGAKIPYARILLPIDFNLLYETFSSPNGFFYIFNMLEDFEPDDFIDSENKRITFEHARVNGNRNEDFIRHGKRLDYMLHALTVMSQAMSQNIFNNMALILSNASLDVTEDELTYVIFEFLKNAVIHGNGADLSKSVMISWGIENNMVVFAVGDQNNEFNQENIVLFPEDLGYYKRPTDYKDWKKFLASKLGFTDQYIGLENIAAAYANFDIGFSEYREGKKSGKILTITFDYFQPGVFSFARSIFYQSS